MSTVSIAAILALLAFQPVYNSENETTLYVGTLLPLSNHWWRSYGVFFVQFLQMVFDEICNSSDILPGYRLELIAKDTQGAAGLGGKKLYELFTEQPPKIAILGAGLSDELALIGQIAQHYSLPLLSFSATSSDVIVDRDAYKSVYVTNFVGESVNPGRIAIMEAFQWTHVATIAYNDHIFESQINDFHRMLQNNNFTLVTSAIITDLNQVSEHMVRFKQYDARIIMGAFRSSQAPYIFCEAYKHNLYGSSFQWILYGGSMYENWVTSFFRGSNKDAITCTEDELIKASNSLLLIDDVYLRKDEDKVIVSGKTARHYNEMIDELKKTNKVSRTHPYAYDAAWALALALNRTQEKLQNGSLRGSRLEDFSYSRTDMYELMLESLQEISFEGASGPVSFNADGERIGPHEISKYYADSRSYVGDLNSFDNLTWEVTESELFNGNPPPIDKFRLITKNLPPHIGAVTVVLIINTLGFIIGIGFLVFNIVYRSNRHIKMSSPNINNIIVVGCFLVYIFIYILTIDYADWVSDSADAICMLKTWLSSIGFTLAFGALFSKTWRVHALFRNKEMKRKVIKDTRLFIHVFILVMVDLVILVPWTAIHRLVKRVHKTKAESESTMNELVTYIYTSCSHKYEMYWYMAEYIYKGLLLAFGAFLAWETRLVTIPALNDSKLIGFCIYNIAVVCAFLVPVTHVLGQEKTTLTFVLVGVFVSLCTSLVLCILFIPKVRLRNQVTDRHFVTSLNSHNGTHNGAAKRQNENGLDLLRIPSSSNVMASNNSISYGDSNLKQLVPMETSTNGIFIVADSPSGKNKAQMHGHGHQGGDDDDNKKMENELREEIKRLNIKQAEEMKAITKLKSDLLKQSNQQLNFHKIGQEYVIFKATPTVFEEIQPIDQAKSNDFQPEVSAPDHSEEQDMALKPSETQDAVNDSEKNDLASNHLGPKDKILNASEPDSVSDLSKENDVASKQVEPSNESLKDWEPHKVSHLSQAKDLTSEHFKFEPQSVLNHSELKATMPDSSGPKQQLRRASEPQNMVSNNSQEKYLVSNNSQPEDMVLLDHSEQKEIQSNSLGPKNMVLNNLDQRDIVSNHSQHKDMASEQKDAITLSHSQPDFMMPNHSYTKELSMNSSEYNGTMTGGIRFLSGVSENTQEDDSVI